MTPTPPVGETPTVALFDLDGVLTRRDTMADLVTRQLKAAPLRLLAAIPPALLARVLPPQHPWVPRLNRALVAIALRGVSPDRYRLLTQDTAHRLATAPGNVPTQAVAAVRDSVQRGRTVVVTATDDRLAREFLTAIGLPDVEVIASQLRHDGPSVGIAAHNVGAAKITNLRHAGIDLSTATLYTDSPSDLPLARQVAATVLVNPTPRAHRVMTRALPSAALRIVGWD